jgi:hypothetical protein
MPPQKSKTCLEIELQAKKCLRDTLRDPDNENSSSRHNLMLSLNWHKSRYCTISISKNDVQLVETYLASFSSTKVRAMLNSRELGAVIVEGLD